MNINANVRTAYKPIKNLLNLLKVSISFFFSTTDDRTIDHRNYFVIRNNRIIPYFDPLQDFGIFMSALSVINRICIAVARSIVRRHRFLVSPLG